MFVSADVMGMIISLFAFAVTVLGGVGWMIGHQTKRMDRRFDDVETRFSAQFDAVDTRFDAVDARFNGVDARLDRVDARLDRVENRLDKVETGLSSLKDELVDVKIAIARFEGPEKRLQRI